MAKDRVYLLTGLERAQYHLNYWTNVLNGELENEMNMPRECIIDSIKHFEDKIELLNANIKLVS